MESQKENTALLVMDMQAGIVRMQADPSALIGNITKAIVYSRSVNIPVIFIRVGFREGMPEISPVNKWFANVKERIQNISMDDFMAIIPDLEPLKDEVIVTKRRISAFTGSDLEVVLRSKGIKHLVLTGLSTSGVVLSTLREAADKDYRITVLSDGCGDADEEVHRVLTTKIFPRQAEVVTAENWIKQD